MLKIYVNAAGYFGLMSPTVGGSKVKRVCTPPSEDEIPSHLDTKPKPFEEPRASSKSNKEPLKTATVEDCQVNKVCPPRPEDKTVNQVAKPMSEGVEDNMDSTKANKEPLRVGDQEYWDPTSSKLSGSQESVVIRYPRNMHTADNTPSEVPLPADQDVSVQESGVTSTYEGSSQTGQGGGSSAISMKTHAPLNVDSVDAEDKASICSAATAATTTTPDVQDLIKAATKTAVDEINKTYKMDQVTCPCRALEPPNMSCNNFINPSSDQDDTLCGQNYQERVCQNDERRLRRQRGLSETNRSPPPNHGWCRR